MGIIPEIRYYSRLWTKVKFTFKQSFDSEQFRITHAWHELRLTAADTK